MKKKGGQNITQKQTDPRRTAEAERRPRSRWQEDWFSTPGDVDDFIFYDAQQEDPAACQQKKTG